MSSSASTADSRTRRVRREQRLALCRVELVVIEKFARSKNRSPIPAYFESTMHSRSPSSRKFAFRRSL